jgi:hypothetical protein
MGYQINGVGFAPNGIDRDDDQIAFSFSKDPAASHYDLTARVAEKGKSMAQTDFDGFYAIYYQGHASPGLAQIQLSNGRIIGADVGGGLWDGAFVIDPVTSIINCEVSIQLAPGQLLATTGLPPKGNEGANMRFQLPPDFASRPFVMLDLPIGKVNLRFQKLRS